MFLRLLGNINVRFIANPNFSLGLTRHDHALAGPVCRVLYGEVPSYD